MAAAVLADLPFALHGQQARAQQGVALIFGHPHAFPDDDVDGAGLVFQRDEDGALGGAGLLPADDDTAGAHLLAVPGGLQLLGAAQAPAGQARAQQRQRVAPQRQAEGGVVVHDFFAFRRGGQHERVLVDGRVAQQFRC